MTPDASARTVAYRTDSGQMHCGDSKDILTSRELSWARGKVQLVFTSPPFPLTTKKSYGNRQGKKYVRWLKSYAAILRDYVTDHGSLVVELGNSWVPGSPTMSTIPLEALLAFKDAGEFHLCQEFICFNPAKLPSPVQWVNVDRIRVKDAFTRVWWLSASERPKADNRRVLTSYSESMKRLLERGTYNPGPRGPGYHISETAFATDNGGAIPPNVLVPTVEELALTEVLPTANNNTNDPYQVYCRENDKKAHQARMPKKLVEFFVKFLTDEGDFVMDPFAGTNTTGWVAELAGRRWISIEELEEYVVDSQVRFRQTNESSSESLPSASQIALEVPG